MKEEDYDLIDRILLGYASADERLAFEQRIKNDPDFKRTHDELSHISQSLRLLEREKLKTMLRQSDKQRKLPISIPLAIAASVLIFALAGYFIWQQRSSAPLFEKYYAQYDEMTFNKPRGPSDHYELKLKAYNHYRKGNIDSAKYNLALIDAQQTDEEAVALMALCLLEAHDFPGAIEEFQKLDPENGNTPAFVKWYLAMAYLGNKNEKEAEALLTELSRTTGSPFSMPAKALLEEMHQPD